MTTMRSFASASNQINNSQKGFTLIELMVAGALTVILVMVITQLMLQTQTLASNMMIRAMLNAEARQMFDLAAFGSFRNLDATGTSDPATPRDHIAGFRGSNSWVEASGTDNSQLKTWHWDNASNNFNGSSSTDLQGHFFYANFNRLSLRYVGLDSATQVTKSVFSSGMNSFVCPSNSGTTAIHPNCTATETTNIGYLFNRNNTATSPSKLANNPLVEYGVTHPAANTYKYFQGDINGRSLNFRMQLVDPEYMVENNLFTYPTNDAVTPQDGHARFRAIPYQMRESYRTSFYMMVDY